MNTCVAITALVIGILLAFTLSEAQWNYHWVRPQHNYGRQSWPDSSGGSWSYSGRESGHDIRGDSGRRDSGYFSWNDNGLRDISHDSRRDSGRDSDAGENDVVSVGGGDKPNAQMQIVLDLHNKYRHQLAKGEVPDQPTGRNVHDLVSSLSQDITMLA